MATEKSGGKGKGKFSDEGIEKKLTSFNNTQDSVQTLSLWIIHHKAHHQKIVEQWLNVFKKSTPRHKLNLFYLCNDVVQHAKRKKLTMYVDCFKEVLKDGVVSVKDVSVKPNIDRIFKIWEERNVYDAKFVDELRSLLDSSCANSVGSKVSPQLLAEFKPQKLIDKINNFKRYEAEVELKGKQLSNLRIDATSVEAVKKLKDRAHGKEFCQQFEDSCVKIEDFVNSLKKDIVDRKSMVEMCEQSELFYDEQFREARIVAHAYKNFGSRITNVKKKADDLKKTLPSAPSPVPSPTVDAPSPGNTPPLETMDNTESVDMDLDDEEGDQPRIVAAPAYSPTAVDGSREMSVSPEREKSRRDHRRSSSSSSSSPPSSGNILENRIASMLTSLPMVTASEVFGASSIATYTPPKPASQTAIPQHQDGGSNTPLSDERCSTPVQDENQETKPLPQAAVPMPVPPPAVKSNPIDFLSQLLTKTTSTSSSSNFLHSLSLLTNTVKIQVTQQKAALQGNNPINQVTTQPSQIVPNVPAPVEPPSSWAAWKAINQPQPPPPPPVPPQPQSQPSSPPLAMSIHSPMPPHSQMHQQTPVPQIPSPQNLGVPPPAPNQTMITSPSIGVPPPPPMNYPSVPPPSSFQPTNLSQGLYHKTVSQSLSGPHQSNYVDQVPSSELLGRQMSWESEEESHAPLNSPPPKPLPPPPKGILRNRSSSLKEVTIIDDEKDKNYNKDEASFPPKPPNQPPPSGDRKSSNLIQISSPAGGVEANSSDVQSEFIAKLKRKTTGGSNLVIPPIVDNKKVENGRPNVFSQNPVRPNLTTITPQADETTESEANSISVIGSNDTVGEPIKTLGHSDAEENDNSTGQQISTIAGVRSAIHRIDPVNRWEDGDLLDPQLHDGHSSWDYNREPFYTPTRGYEQHGQPRFGDPRHYYSRDPYYGNPYRPPPPKRMYPGSYNQPYYGNRY
ncbi:hypothetical protein CHS0354_029301 [Potamilus streckersoni]|uniref:Regulation of nuclear pre-mRNA domain-containing protein 2 n=1 Tax=Potamilus streckersoni TaxID=2493646 RepID=A0AAE0SZT6_9BIVA|nr:hypothetical protein CHS0354_029301 [Potamilus streckersoni]